MKSAIALVALSLSPIPQDTGRVPIAPDPTPAATTAPTPERAPERALAAIRQASEALRAWNDAAAAGAAIDAEELGRVRQATEILMKDLQALHGRMRAQEAALPKPARASANERGAKEDEGSNALATAARDISHAWVDDARALGDGASARRERAIAAVREALTNGDATAKLAALQTLTMIGDVEYDKASFRPLVLPFARDGKKEFLATAFYALNTTAREPGDLDLLHAAWTREPEALREKMMHLLSVFGGGKLDGRSEEIALELLEKADRNTNTQFSGMWGARVGPRLEARVLELSRSSDEGVRHAAIYFGLSTFADKSAAVVDALIATLTDPDSNNSERALWGLGHGVPEELQHRVAAALVELHNGRSNATTRATCARLVKQYGGPEFEAKLKR